MPETLVNDFATYLSAPLAKAAGAGTKVQVTVPLPAAYVGKSARFRVASSQDGPSEIVLFDLTAAGEFTVVSRQVEDADRFPSADWGAGTALEQVLTDGGLSKIMQDEGSAPDLSAYAKLTDLPPYIDPAELMAALASYATTASLADYAKTNAANVFTAPAGVQTFDGGVAVLTSARFGASVAGVFVGVNNAAGNKADVVLNLRPHASQTGAMVRVQDAFGNAVFNVRLPGNRERMEVRSMAQNDGFVLRASASTDQRNILLCPDSDLGVSRWQSNHDNGAWFLSVSDDGNAYRDWRTLSRTLVAMGMVAASPVFVVNGNNAAHTGDLAQFQKNGVTQASISSGGVFSGSAILSGTPTTPTAVVGTNTTQIASTAFVRAEVASLVDSSPGTLDTLNELAAALGDDPNFATTVTTALAGKQPAATGTPNGTKFLRDDNSWQTTPPTFTATFVLAAGTPITTGTNKTNELVVPFACALVKAYARAKTGPTGADLIVDINVNGTTIWSTQANRVKITAGGTSGSQTSFNTATLAEGDVLTIDVDQVGSGVAGQDVTVILYGR